MNLFSFDVELVNFSTLMSDLVRNCYLLVNVLNYYIILFFKDQALYYFILGTKGYILLEWDRNFV